MIYIVVGENQKERKKAITTIVDSKQHIIFFDETNGSVADLEQYVYPSLFVQDAPIVHSKYVINNDISSYTNMFIEKLLSSPTVFLFEEIELSASAISFFKKKGAIIHTQTKKEAKKSSVDIFSSVNAIILGDKKHRWLAYRAALEQQPVEALMGLLYWKVRDLTLKDKKHSQQYRALYTALLRSHAEAWNKGTPLELLIEKVLLEQ